MITEVIRLNDNWYDMTMSKECCLFYESNKHYHSRNEEDLEKHETKELRMLQASWT